MKEYRQLSKEEVVDILSSRNKFLILFHINPDGDATASAFSLKRMLEACGKEAYCLCAHEVPERLQFITGDQSSVLIDSLPENYNHDCVITCDTASPSRLGDLMGIFEDKIDLMIDHHGVGTVYADNFIVTSASATGEILYDLFTLLAQRCGINEIPQDVCQLVYTAISSDTGCFRYNNVKAHTHQIAAELISRGIDSAFINHRLFGIKSLRQMQVEHAGFERMNFYDDGKIAVITFPHDLKVQYGADDETLETLIDVARCVKGVEISVVIKQSTEEKKYRVSTRSNTNFDVAKLCALYGGGGHERAAGCTLNCDSILAAEITMVSAIENLLSEK